MDLYPSEDMYESFRRYQTALLAQFDAMAQEYDFTVIDASPDIRAVFERLRAGISRVLKGEPREPLFAVPAPEVAVADSGRSEVAGAGKAKRPAAEK
jgi:dTMP kinase